MEKETLFSGRADRLKAMFPDVVGIVGCKWWCAHRIPSHEKTPKAWFIYQLSADRRQDARRSIRWHEKTYGWKDCILIDMKKLLRKRIMKGIARMI